MDLNAAMSTHVAWRMKLRSAMSRKELLDVAAIGAAHQCDLGKWIAGDGRTRLGQVPEFAALERTHEAFHRAAARVAAAVNAGDRRTAERMLEGEGEYGKASMEVAKAIVAVQQHGV